MVAPQPGSVKPLPKPRLMPLPRGRGTERWWEHGGSNARRAQGGCHRPSLDDAVHGPVSGRPPPRAAWHCHRPWESHTSALAQQPLSPERPAALYGSTSGRLSLNKGGGGCLRGGAGMLSYTRPAQRLTVARAAPPPGAVTAWPRASPDPRFPQCSPHLTSVSTGKRCVRKSALPHRAGSALPRQPESSRNPAAGKPTSSQSRHLARAQTTSLKILHGISESQPCSPINKPRTAASLYKKHYKYRLHSATSAPEKAEGRRRALEGTL